MPHVVKPYIMKVRFVQIYNLNYSTELERLQSDRLVIMRAKHVINEINWTEKVSKALAAKDLALVSALRRILDAWERYAETYGFSYNANKSELLIFESGTKIYKIVPPAELGGVSLNLVSQHKMQQKIKIDFQVGELFYKSHDSLSNFMEISCPELDQIVDVLKRSTGVYGARMTGGGFGGCVVALVKKTNVEEAKKNILSHYKGNPTFFICQPSDGARVLKL